MPIFYVILFDSPGRAFLIPGWERQAPSGGALSAKNGSTRLPLIGTGEDKVSPPTGNERGRATAWRGLSRFLGFGKLTHQAALATGSVVFVYHALLSGFIQGADRLPSG